MKLFLIITGSILGLFLLIAAIIGLNFFSTRSTVIELDEESKSNWAQIDVQLQRRVDLIPNLVNTAKGYAKHEEKVFADIANARSMLLAAKGPEAKAKADAQVTSSLGRLLAVAENYPNLKANTNFVRLMDELSGTENRISVSRTRYNNSVKEYNIVIRQIFGSIWASMLGLSKKEYFEAPQSRQVLDKAPEVKF